jgi:hypothetical protein
MTLFVAEITDTRRNVMPWTRISMSIVHGCMGVYFVDFGSTEALLTEK